MCSKERKMQYQMNQQVPGVGYIGQLAQAPDGRLYQLSQSIDGLGNVSPTWLPVDGMGQAPSYDQPQLGEVRRGSDGQLYQYAQTVDGLGNIGFAWASLIPLAAQVLPSITNAVGSLFGGGKSSAPGAAASPGIDWRQIIPQIAQAVAGILGRGTGVSGLGEGADYYSVPRGIGLDADDPLGLVDDDLGLDDPYVGENGNLYRVEGFGEGPDDLRGLEEDFDSLRGYGAYPDDLGMAADDPLNGMDGYLRQPSESQMRGYVPTPSPSPAFVSQANPSPLWQSLW
jgi:hypothetical protein